MWKLITKSNVIVKENGFWKSLKVYIERPNILNKRVFGSHALQIWHLMNPSFDFNVEDFIDKIENVRNTSSNVTEDVRSVINSLVKTFSNTDNMEELTLNSVTLHNLLPRSKERFTEELQLVLIDISNKTLIVYPLSKAKPGYRITPNAIYKFVLDHNGYICLFIKNDLLIDDPSSQSEEWLKNWTFPKIVKWAKVEIVSGAASNSSVSSLSLIKIDKYNSIRLLLREKYAEKFIDLWPEDGTDPLKFVHEDIAIAAYLISLWQEEYVTLNLNRKQSFVDLGCGNGLLTFILTSEGYPGIGIDLRKRKLWDLLPNTILKESVISPNCHSLFPDYDWIIGNHSDELTPWIPVIAARSSYKMRVFLLPCCPYTFDGKYQRTNEGSSQYQSYLIFVKRLCSSIGFNVKIDKLRIPSTKRTCFVCDSRNYSEDDKNAQDEIIRMFIEENSKRGGDTINVVNDSSSINDDHDKTEWSTTFKPREKLVAVKNCTQLGKSFLQDSVNTIANMLLSSGNSKHCITTLEGSKNLTYGGSMTLGELAERLSNEMKLKFKQQNGGLQTLIRNHRHVFEVVDGRVRITAPLIGVPRNAAAARQKNKIKSVSSIQCRPCWFFNNHPEKCPLRDDECRYSHQL